MSRHNVIVVSGDPKGHFIEGNMIEAAGAFRPGQIVSIKSDAELIDGRPQYELWNGAADGERSEIVIIRENDLLGMPVDGEYDAGSRFLGYIPVPGDEVQVLLSDFAGTGTAGGAADVALGTKLIVDDGTGKVIPTTGTPESEPFTAMEALDDVLEDTLILCRFNGG